MRRCQKCCSVKCWGCVASFMLLADRTSCTAASSLPSEAGRACSPAPSPCRGPGCANSRRGSHRSSNLSRCGCKGCSLARPPKCPKARLRPRRRRRPLPPRSHCCRLLYGLCCATLRSCARCQEALYVVGCSCGPGRGNAFWGNYTKDKDEPRSRTTWPSRSVSRKRRCLSVMGPLTAIKCPSSEPVSSDGAHAPQIAQHAAGVCQLSGGSGGRPCCMPSCGRTQRPAVRQRRSWGQACGRC